MKNEIKIRRPITDALRCSRKRIPVILSLSVTLAMPFPSTIQANELFNYSAIQQSITQVRKIKGVVVDEAGEPLIGVSILVKGSTAGAITDLDGNFSLDVSESSKTLIVSYIGYKTQEIAIGTNKQFSVKLVTDTQALDEVVVIGYGTVKKRDLTGAITSVKNEDITLTPSANPMQALQGKVAGLDITKSSGQAGSGVTMQLRGKRSFEASSNPTFIIDGMPGDYSTLNPNDIQSIEVLKDASSTAVYGSAGSNGVIIITTKAGNVGKVNINVNAYAGFNGWSTLPKMRSGESYINTMREAKQAAGTYISDENLFSSTEAYQAHLDGKYLNWADLLMQNGFTQNYSISAQGGTEKTKAYFSMNFSDEQGQYTGDNYKVYSTNIKVDHKVKDWLSLGVNMQGSYVYQNKAYAKLINALVSIPLGEAYDENGKVNVTPIVGNGNTINLLLDQDKSVYRNNNQNFKLYLNPYIEIKPLKGLSLISRLNLSLNYNRSNYFQGIGSYQYYNEFGASTVGTNDKVYASITQNRNYNYKWENIATYKFDIDDHSFTLTGVTTWNHNQSDNSYMMENNILNNKFLWHNMDSKTAAVTSSYRMSKGLGFIGRINYSYLGRYLFSASMRKDGSSVLASGNRWNSFPAFSVGWRISDENFMKETQDWLSNLKLRVGYGVTGVSSIDSYTSTTQLDNNYYSLGGVKEQTYYFSKNYPNADLSWEKSYNWNFGLDASFLKNRIELTADFYNTKTKGVIWSRKIPVTNGAYDASTQYFMNMNICQTKNTGLELSLNTRNIDTKEFKWSSSLTFAQNKEKIVSLTDGVSNNISNGDYTLTIGQPVNSYYKYKIDGIWQLGEETDANVFGTIPGGIKVNVPGLIRESAGVYYKVNESTGEKTYYNADKKYVVSGADYQTIGHNSPDWTAGFQNQFTYKNFDLTIYAYIRWGQMINYEMLGYYNTSGTGNFPKYFNYWTQTNPSNDFPAMNSSKELKSYTGYSDLGYVDGSFFKIKNVTLGYTFSKNVLKTIGMEKCRLYATMTNPLIVAKSHLLKQYDPEMNGDLNYPLTKQLVFGVNISF